MPDTMPEAAPQGDHQTFKLVDARTGSEDVQSGGGCGCGGHGGHGGGHGHGGGQGGCGCGGHGHAREAQTVKTESTAGGGCGCGGHGGGHAHAGGQKAEAKAEQAQRQSTAGGCGCGGHGGGHGVGAAGGHAHPGGAGIRHQPGADELVIHSIPHVVRHAVLFAAVDSLPVGENIQICAPHQPGPLFAHLQNSESHYRVETLESGPVDWRYRITRLS